MGGFAIEETIKAFMPDEVYFWAAPSGAERDLLLIKNGIRIGVDHKRVDAPRMTSSMRIACSDLDLSRLLVIHPGPQPYPLDRNIQATPHANLAEGLAILTDLAEI